jgi:hypothetical protein
LAEVGLNKVNGLESQLKTAREPLLARCDNAAAEAAGRVDVAVSAMIVMPAMIVIVPGVIVVMAVAVLVRIRHETYSVTNGCM